MAKGKEGTAVAPAANANPVGALLGVINTAIKFECARAIRRDAIHFGDADAIEANNHRRQRMTEVQNQRDTIFKAAVAIGVEQSQASQLLGRTLAAFSGLRDWEASLVDQTESLVLETLPRRARESKKKWQDRVKSVFEQHLLPHMARAEQQLWDKVDELEAGLPKLRDWSLLIDAASTSGTAAVAATNGHTESSTNRDYLSDSANEDWWEQLSPLQRGLLIFMRHRSEADTAEIATQVWRKDISAMGTGAMATTMSKLNSALNKLRGQQKLLGKTPREPFVKWK